MRDWQRIIARTGAFANKMLSGQLKPGRWRGRLLGRELSMTALPPMSPVVG